MTPTLEDLKKTKEHLERTNKDRPTIKDNILRHLLIKILFWNAGIVQYYEVIVK